MPLFLMMGGEFVIAFLAARIGLWMLRGRHDIHSVAREPRPPEGGVPAAVIELPKRPVEARAARRRAA